MNNKLKHILEWRQPPTWSELCTSTENLCCEKVLWCWLDPIWHPDLRTEILCQMFRWESAALSLKRDRKWERLRKKLENIVQLRPASWYMNIGGMWPWNWRFNGFYLQNMTIWFHEKKLIWKLTVVFALFSCYVQFRLNTMHQYDRLNWCVFWTSWTWVRIEIISDIALRNAGAWTKFRSERGREKEQKEKYHMSNVV